MKLSFKNRIAFHYMIATAIMMTLVFAAIFFSIYKTVWENLDNDLYYEAKKHTGEIQVVGDSIKFINKAEWKEREHRESQVNPVFIQVMNKDGHLMDKSPNLKLDRLPFKQSEFGGHFNAKLNKKNIRQVQLPIESKGKIKGYMLAAMSSESALAILSKLRDVLLGSYFIVLIGLYFVSRFLAGRSIRPIMEMTDTITRISQFNLQKRVHLPQQKDEIYQLSAHFNALLGRIEKAIAREKQFTSDASHELRTPLATLRGTLEVLIRKPRDQQEYEDKIKFCLKELDRITAMLEQLLLLARSETSSDKNNEELILLPSLIDEAISHYKSQITQKELKISLEIKHVENVSLPHYYSSIIIENILGNAIKYSNNKGVITVSIKNIDGQILCTIEDEGIGIRKEDLAHIYDSFYRSDALRHKHISGNGLGLSIAKKCANAIGAELEISSTYGEGTVVSIIF